MLAWQYSNIWEDCHEWTEAHQIMFQQHADQDGGEPVDERFMDLIEKVLRGADPDRKQGTDQGDPYSPFALLVLLHTSLDVPIAEGVSGPGYFFAHQRGFLGRGFLSAA